MANLPGKLDSICKMVACIDKVNGNTPVNAAQDVEQYQAVRLERGGGKQALPFLFVLQYFSFNFVKFHF